MSWHKFGEVLALSYGNACTGIKSEHIARRSKNGEVRETDSWLATALSLELRVNVK